MAPSVSHLAALRLRLLLVAVFSPSCCEAQNPSSIVDNAILCFNNTSIYRNCQEQYRLTANGTLNVSGNAVDAFCSGPCLAETQLVLSCVDGILSNFKFYNGATIRAVNATILIACGKRHWKRELEYPRYCSSSSDADSSIKQSWRKPSDPSHSGSWPLAVGSWMYMVLAS
ncbi:unnamed protein product [Spirodela intermedia]|uniref:DUF7731 domain-containing protein n=1 Tax=Spirodela intermedia TaxID=51605 RepID=A0A7I8IVG9_SPIIN|nr:unnamed protein product [Spirodela intermedia]CAA6661987.1 unnamed protein product [Spirodela intermedia]